MLIVDDNPANRFILREQVKRWQMTPTTAECGGAALALLDSGAEFELAILDMQMPEMDGLELAQAIRSRPPCARLPLVMLTSMGDNLHAEAGNAPGFLAEDNVVNQKVAQQILGRLGCSADLAADGREAVAAVQRQPYDLVLMEVQMPEMDGLEATSVIRRTLPGDQQPAILAMTVAAMPEDRQRGMEAGMDGYVAKPLRIGELTEALHRAWNARETSSGGKAAKSVSGSAGEFFTR